MSRFMGPRSGPEEDRLVGEQAHRDPQHHRGGDHAGPDGGHGVEGHDGAHEDLPLEERGVENGDEEPLEGNVVLDRTTRVVTVGTRKIQLTPSEFEMLAILMAAPGQVFSRADLLERLKGDLFDNVERTVDTHIHNLRTKLEPDASDPQYIQTVFGVGYRFNPDVDETAA